MRFYRVERRPEKHQLPDLEFGLDAESEKVARGCAVIASIRGLAFKPNTRRRGKRPRPALRIGLATLAAAMIVAAGLAGSTG